jgi:hypothetical protein
MESEFEIHEEGTTCTGPMHEVVAFSLLHAVEFDKAPFPDMSECKTDFDKWHALYTYLVKGEFDERTQE